MNSITVKMNKDARSRASGIAFALVFVFVFGCFSLLSFSFSSFQQGTAVIIDTLQYPKGFRTPVYSALTQLRQYPAPRYAPGNKLIRLFNWMDPMDMGGNSQPGVTKDQAVKTSVELQEELALHWNYNIVIPNTIMAGSDKALASPANPTLSYIKLANKYPDIPLGVITFWMQVKPSLAGFPYKSSLIRNKLLDERYYWHRTSHGKDIKEINFEFPDSLIRMDGLTQRLYLSNILRQLTRPIDLINENGEEPPSEGGLEDMKKDPLMIRLKDSMGMSDWKTFMAWKKCRMRAAYSSAFMDLPGLKKTMFTVYAVEGGPIDRFEWPEIKKCMTPLNGNYYSTPDFYPRKPSNWLEWQGPWHGWKWIVEGRRNEIRDGDELSSPFVCAGWAKNPVADIRPAQWLGLLKCLSAAGAEFFYVGYFNIGKPPFTDPRQYVWQAAVASYAQAITSRYEDELRNGALLTADNGKTAVYFRTDDPNVLLVVRKHKTKDRYLICATLQPFSNNKGEVPEKRKVTAEFKNTRLTFEVRRQGSVYIYDVQDKTHPLFFQLDSWHESSHPDFWTKDFFFEAEIQDGDKQLPVFTETPPGSQPGDYSTFTSFIKINTGESSSYRFNSRDSVTHYKYIKMQYRSNEEAAVSLLINGKELPKGSVKVSQSLKWKWINIDIPESFCVAGDNTLTIQVSKGMLELNSFFISRAPVK